LVDQNISFVLGINAATTENKHDQESEIEKKE